MFCNMSLRCFRGSFWDDLYGVIVPLNRSNFSSTSVREEFDERMKHLNHSPSLVNLSNDLIIQISDSALSYRSKWCRFGISSCFLAIDLRRPLQLNLWKHRSFLIDRLVESESHRRSLGLSCCGPYTIMKPPNQYK